MAASKQYTDRCAELWDKGNPIDYKLRRITRASTLEGAARLLLCAAIRHRLPSAVIVTDIDVIAQPYIGHMFNCLSRLEESVWVGKLVARGKAIRADLSAKWKALSHSNMYAMRMLRLVHDIAMVATKSELIARDGLSKAMHDLVYNVPTARSVLYHSYLPDGSHKNEKQWQNNALKEIFGNPYRPTEHKAKWRSDTIVKQIATAIMNDKSFNDLPVLADALEDAGCDDLDVLNHCRSNTEHLHGCWVIRRLLCRTTR